MKKKRRFWKACKELGDKVNLFIDAIGTGALVLLSSQVPTNTLAKWRMVKVRLLIYGLGQGPKAGLFRHLCNTIATWAAKIGFNNSNSALEIPQFEKSMKDFIVKELDQAPIRASIVSFQDRLQKVIEDFPSLDDAIYLGCLLAAPTIKNMRTLAEDSEIDDEIIRASLGLAQKKILGPWKQRFMDPGL